MINKMISKVALAAVAVVGFSASATATLPKENNCIKVTTGGFFKFAGAFVRKNNDFVTLNGRNIKNRRGDFWMDAEVIVKADGQAECYKYGAEVQLEANPGNQRKTDTTYTFSNLNKSATTDGKGGLVSVDSVNVGKAAYINADKVYMYVSNDYFGRVEAGSTDSAIQSLWSYIDAGMDGSYQDFLGDEVIDSIYKPRSMGRNLQVYYVTPRYEGIQFGTSWAPVLNRKGRAVTRTRVATTDPGTGKLADENFDNAGEYAINYTNTLCGNVGIKLSTGFSHAHPLMSAQSHEPWRAYGFAGMLTYCGFSFGGTYTNNGKSGYFKGTAAKPVLSSTKESGYSGGVQYEVGPYTVGANYVSLRTAGDTTVAGTDRSRLVSGSATYKAAEGLSIFMQGVQVRRTLKAGPTKDNGSVALLGTRLDW